MSEMPTISTLLRPSEREIYDLVLREMDPSRAAEFEQLCPGPWLAGLLLAGVILCAVVVSPYRIVWRLIAGAGRMP